ncbi:MAG TPA: glycosyltransferase family 4 protein [Thermomicrobiaceae bacterium]|nr:glycosyltransferase family 4 protein [Thermomicrobiaceae bacterium]
MKILLVTPFDFSSPGGVNDHILHLDREIQALGHTTHILSPRSEEEEEEDDGHLYKLGTSMPVPSNGSTARITLSPLITGKVREFLQREAFDVIHLHEPLAPMLPIWVLRYSDSVNVGTYHAARQSTLAYYSWKPLLAPYEAKLHARVAVSLPAQEFVSQCFPGSYQVIPNGIDIERFGPSVEPVHHYRDGVKNILFVGRFNESRKGLKYLLRALAIVRRTIPDVRLLVVGHGKRERYERIIQRHSIENVVFVGPVASHYLPAYYATCDVFCAPSTGRESFGMILLEAMASGKPVVASDISGYAAVVRDGIEGLLVEPKDPEALAEALIRLLGDEQLRERLGAAGRRRAQEHSWPVVAGRILDVYERTLDRVSRQRYAMPGSRSYIATRH